MLYNFGYGKGGEANWTCILGVTSHIRKTGKIDLNKSVIYRHRCTPFSPQLFYLPSLLQLSRQKGLFTSAAADVIRLVSLFCHFTEPEVFPFSSFVLRYVTSAHSSFILQYYVLVHVVVFLNSFRPHIYADIDMVSSSCPP